MPNGRPKALTCARPGPPEVLGTDLNDKRLEPDGRVSTVEPVPSGDGIHPGRG
jgi:hypothetical protein